MVVTPIICYKSPHYPDKQTALKDPLLLKNLPRRWAGRAATVTAVTATAAMMLTGCGENSAIAPIFEHGSGYGVGEIQPPAGFMGLLLGPSTFIGEDEANIIINNLLNQEGLDFNVKNQLVKTQLPVITAYGKGTDVHFNDGMFVLDGYDPLKNIGYEFVSEEDLGGMYYNQDGMNIDVLATAKEVRQGLTRQSGDTVIGVFYDPISDPQENLKLQVKDFIAWLKAEKII